MGKDAPAGFELELLSLLAAEQARLERGDWGDEGTLWSRVAFLMAQARGKVAPSPVRNKANLDRAFATSFIRTVKRLVARGLVRFRAIGPSRGEPQYFAGYNLHQLRDRDIAITEEGLALVAARGAPAVGVAVTYIEAPPAGETYVITVPAVRGEGE